MKILTDEIRERFSSSEDITFESLAGLEYLNACTYDIDPWTAIFHI